MAGPGKCKTIDRKRRKPAQQRAVADRRWEKNRVKKKETAARRLEKKKKRVEDKISSAKTVSEYKKLRHTCPKLCAEAHQAKKEQLHVNPTLEGDGFAERFIRDHKQEILEKLERDKYVIWLKEKLKRSYIMAPDKKKKQKEN